MKLQGRSGVPVKSELKSIKAPFLVEPPRSKPLLPDLSYATSPDSNRVTGVVIDLKKPVLARKNKAQLTSLRTTTSCNALMPSFCHYETALTDRNTMPAPSEQGNC
jgi:hypothetical protein